MRKFTRFMLAALLCIVGKGVAQAEVITDPSQLSNDKVYTISCPRGTFILNYDETKIVSSHASDGENVNEDVSEDPEATHFAILNFDGLYYIYSPKLEQFASAVGEFKFYSYKGTGLTFSDDGLEEGYKGSRLRLGVPEESLFVNNNNAGLIKVDGWTTADGGNTLAIEEVEGVTFDLEKAKEIFKIQKPDYWWKDSHKVFYLSTVRAGNLACNGEYTTLIGTMQTDVEEEDTWFAFWMDGDKFYIYNVGSNKFLTSDGHLTSSPAEVGNVGYKETGNDDYPIAFYFKDTNIYFNTQGNGTDIAFNTWSTLDDGNRIMIEEVPGEDVYDKMEAFFSAPVYDITYRLYFNDKEIGTATRQMTPGSDAQLPSDMILESCWYNYDPEVIEDDSEVRVDVLWDGPENMFSESFDDATWWNLSFDRTKHGDGTGSRWYAWYEEGREPYYPEQDADDAKRAAAQCQWAFIGNPYAVTVYNKSAGPNMSLTYDQINVAGTDRWAAVLRPGIHEWVIKNYHLDTDEFSLGAQIEDKFWRINQFGGASTSSFYGLWDGYDDGSKLSIEAAPNIDVTDVYFDIYFDGELVTTEKVIGQEMGNYIPELPTSVNIGDLVEFDYDEDETVNEEDQHVRVDATWLGNFEISKDFGSAHWYDMSVRNTWYVTSDNVDDAGALKTVNANAIGLAEDSYQWAFVGNPWRVKIYNKAKGGSVAFSWTGTGNESVPTFVDDSEAKAWTLRKSVINNDEDGIYDDAFMITVPGTNDQLNQYGGAGGSLKHWNSTTIADIGSAFKVFDVPTDFAQFVAAEITPIMESESKWFNFTDAAVNRIGYQPEYKESCPFDAYKSMKLAIEEAMNDASNFNFPPSGWYRLKSKYYGDFFGLTSDQTMADPDGTAASTVVRLNKVGDFEYTIQAQNAYFQPLTRSESMTTSETDEVTWKAFIVTPGFASFSSKPEYEEITAEEDQTLADEFTYSFLHRRAEGDYVGWTKEADASMFQVIPAKFITVEVGPEGVGSLYVPFAVTAPEGVVPFSGKINGEEVQMTPIKGSIPASTPFVILADEGTYDFPIVADGAEVATVAENDLKGTYINYLTSGALVPLESGTDKAFGIPEMDMPANSAYIRPEDTSIDEFIMVFGDFTAIKGVEDKQESTMFDLSGRRVNKANKGVYIIDGKKMLVK